MWSTLKKLIWIKINAAAALIWSTATGASPLALVNAIANSIKSLTQFGKCVQASTPTPDAPANIVCNNGALKWDSVNQRVYADGTPEVLTVGGKNITSYILDMTVEGDGTSATLASGILTGDYAPKEGRYTISIDVQSEDVTYSQNGTLVYFTITYYGGSRDFIGVSNQNYMRNRISVITAPGKTITSLALMKNARFTGGKIRVSNLQVEEGTTATDYEPYVSPQTVTDIPMLLSAGDITDEKDIISGGVTHRIGYHVFDGTETFSTSRAYGMAFLINAAYAAWGADRTKAVLCTHFLGLPQKSSTQDDNTCFFNSTGHFYFRVTDNSDTDAFKAWLAGQYASGSPVIVFFVLAEETTEQTTPHSLNSYEGATVVEALTNVDPVTLSAEYAATS